MREIKFRAWALEEEKMYYSPDMTDWDGFDAWLRLDCEDNDIGEGSVKLMQYTGLKDKNSKEIYEGDVVRGRFFDGKLETSKVEWPKLCGGFTFFGYPPNVHGLSGLEIIGNIYENPELEIE